MGTNPTLSANSLTLRARLLAVLVVFRPPRGSRARRDSARIPPSPPDFANRSLRSRRGFDIPMLVRYFAQRFAKALRRPIESVSRESMEMLCRWP